MKRQLFFWLLVIVLAVFVILWQHFNSVEPFSGSDIPIVVICWNNYYFVRNFVEQLRRFPYRIILLDNASTYPPLLDFYDQVDGNGQVEVRRLDQNYGHMVYMTLKDQLPDVYILSDPDLEIGPEMPIHFAEIWLALSEKYQVYKLGAALRIDDKQDFIDCPNYTAGKGIFDFESQYWVDRIDHGSYELYKAGIDTTLCLVNNRFWKGDAYEGIRVAGPMAVRHLPWYSDYIKSHVDPTEIEFWKANNKSSSILFTCLSL